VKDIFPIKALKAYQKRIGKDISRFPVHATQFRKELVKLCKGESTYFKPLCDMLDLPDPTNGANELDLIHLENACLYHMTREQIDEEITAHNIEMTHKHLGFLGGSKTSKVKKKTSAENGRKSKGRPRKTV
jgi:hypothetical protein